MLDVTDLDAATIAKAARADLDQLTQRGRNLDSWQKLHFARLLSALYYNRFGGAGPEAGLGLALACLEGVHTPVAERDSEREGRELPGDFDAATISRELSYFGG